MSIPWLVNLADNFLGNMDDQGAGFDFAADNRYASSMRKMLDEADRLVQGRGLPDGLFLREDAGLINPELLGRMETFDPINDEIKITPGKIRDIEQHYLLDTVERTRRRRSPRMEIEGGLEERLEGLADELAGLERFRLGYNAILDHLLGKEAKANVLETIAEQNDEFKELCEAIQGERVDPEVQDNIIELDRLYKEAVEVGRANQPFETEIKTEPQLGSDARGPGSAPQLSSDHRFGDNFQLDNQNMDIIYETMNENFTRTNYLNSYQIWTRLDDRLGTLIRECQRGRRP